ncbi:MAG: hypothetical protein LDL33_14555 [Desulfomonile sp.]|nr:hypothetical protein [Desulfomonile sp.]
MRKPKIRIGKKTVVSDIRRGVDDIGLMRAYGLSARGLEKLFAKLIATGQISQTEFEQRALRSQRSHMVELINLSESPLSKAFISASEAVADIRAGMSDTELMEKHSLSARGLEDLLRKLVKAGVLNRSEISSRRPSGRKSVEVSTNDEDFPADDAPDTESRLGGIVGRYRTYFAAAAGALGGMALLWTFLFLVCGIGFPTRDARRELEATVKALHQQAEEMIAILEDIIRQPLLSERPGIVSGESLAGEYQQCLENCERSLPGLDDMDKILVLNCKKACIGKYSNRAKNIRERFY